MKTLLRKRLVSLFVLLCCTWGTITAQTYRLSGCVKDETGTPVEVANVILLHSTDSMYQDGMITDTNGCFQLQEPKGNYLLRVTLLGYQDLSLPLTLSKDTDLGSLVLKNLSIAMSEVTVTAAKPVIRREIDRVVFDAGNSIASVGGNALDLLHDVPGLRVSQSGVDIIGKGGIKIYINDRETKLSGEELINFLRSYSASQISKVEVITTPPARYDAEGNAGILNIRLKERVKDHIGGNAFGSYLYGEKYNYGYGGLSLQFNRQRVTAYLNGSGAYGKTGYVERNGRFYTDQTWRSRSESDYSLSSFYVDGGIDIDMGRQWNIGTQLTYINSAPNNVTDNRTEVHDIQELRTDSFMLGRDDKDYSQNRVNVNFHVDKSWGDKGHKMIWDVDYLKDKSNTFFDFDSESHLPTGEIIPGSEFNYDKNQRRTVDVISSALDFILPGDSYSFTTGAKASFTDTRNRLNYDNSNVSFTQNDFFRYKEQIYALYADYSHNFGSHFSMKAGLRLEHTRTTGISESQQTTDKHDYTRLFPTFYLMYKPNEDNVLNMNISSRISRPAQNMVNPFLTYENKYSEHRGKEDLKPSYRYNAELSYTLKHNLNFSIFYSYATDVFSQRLMLNEETHVLSSLWDNYMKNRSFGITNSYTFRLGWLQTFAQHTLKYNRTTSSAPETHPKNSGWDYNINIRNTFYLNTAKTLVASLSGYYSGPSHDQVSHREGSYGASGGIRYSMLGNKLNLSLNVSDFLVKNMQGTSYSNGLYTKFNNTFTYTSFRIGVSYNFGADIKRKKHNLSNTDIQNRL